MTIKKPKRQTQRRAPALPAPTGSEWARANIALELTRSAFKQAARNREGADMCIAYLENAVEALKRIPPNAKVSSGD